MARARCQAMSAPSTGARRQIVLGVLSIVYYVRTGFESALESSNGRCQYSYAKSYGSTLRIHPTESSYRVRLPERILSHIVLRVVLLGEARESNARV